MVAIPFWDDAPEVWDTVFLGGLQLPGVAKVDIEKGRDVDVKKASGSDGGTISDKGYVPAKVRIAVTFVSAQDWDEAQNVYNAITPFAKSKNQKPFDIIHPKCALGDPIRSVYVKSVKWPDFDNGLCSVELECVEYLKPVKKKVVTPKASQGGGGGAGGSSASGARTAGLVDSFVNGLTGNPATPSLAAPSQNPAFTGPPSLWRNLN